MSVDVYLEAEEDHSAFLPSSHNLKLTILKSTDSPALKNNTV